MNCGIVGKNNRSQEVTNESFVNFEIIDMIEWMYKRRMYVINYLIKFLKNIFIKIIMGILGIIRKMKREEK